MAGTETALDRAESQAAYKVACSVMPNGVGFATEMLCAAGATPRFMAKGAGAILTDVDGNEYVDYVCCQGSLILGHADDRVVAAINKAAAKGAALGAATEAEVRLAEMVVARVPGVELTRFVSSRVEAVMNAVALARAFTARSEIVTFDGCCHGYDVSLMADTIGLPFNDTAVVEQVFAERGGAVAAVMLEPVATGAGCVPAEVAYLKRLRALCSEHGALLVFDETMTAFRVAAGGAQEAYGVVPDLTCLGGALGGGLGLAAFGGRADVMGMLSPSGEVVQVGGPAAQPISAAAGLATLEVLAERSVYGDLEEKSARLESGLAEAARKAGVKVHHNRVGSMLATLLADGPATDAVWARLDAVKRYGQYHHAMLDRGVCLPASRFGCLFVSLAHTDELIERTVSAAAEAFGQMAGA